MIVFDDCDVSDMIDLISMVIDFGKWDFVVDGTFRGDLKTFVLWLGHNTCCL